MRRFGQPSTRACAISAWSLVGVAAFGIWHGRLGAQPPPATIERGEAVYREKCVECHGVSGKGDGPASPLLTPRPRDFTSGRYKLRSTENGSLPTDADLIQSVSQGVYGSAMPAWQSLLPDTDIGAVVDYIKSLSTRFASEQPQVVPIGPQVAASPEGIERGRATYETLQCAKCHGTDGRGAGAVATAFEDDWGQPLKATDLTEPWTFHGGATARDIYLRFRTGMSGTPMPSFKDAATDGEMWDLANYVVSMGRKPVWTMTAPEISALYAQQAADAARDPVKRGEYLVETHLCAICHSPIDQDSRILPGMKLAGGQLIRINPFGDFPTGNLTSDKETGLGNWTDEEITQVITRGILRDGTRLPPYPMPWPEFSALTNDDVNAIVAYLRTVPSVSNRVPRPTRPFLPVYLWGKFKMLILQQDPPIIIFSGNAGSAGGVE